jgi:hypothetical protein
VQIVFVASLFIEWHGLDKVVAAAKRSSRDFILHVVGAIDDKDLLSEAQSCPKIQLHGMLTPGQLTALELRCDIGLGSFALERKGMKEACPLKVRNYLSEGLSVYAGHPDIFPDSFPYYREGDCDFDAVTDFALETRSVSRSQVEQAAQPYIDKQQLVRGLYEFLYSACKQSRRDIQSDVS